MGVTTLDRPRVVLSFKGTHLLRRPGALPNARVTLYGEFHYLPDIGIHSHPDPVFGTRTNMMP